MQRTVFQKRTEDETAWKGIIVWILLYYLSVHDGIFHMRNQYSALFQAELAVARDNLILCAAEPARLLKIEHSAGHAYSPRKNLPASSRNTDP